MKAKVNRRSLSLSLVAGLLLAAGGALAADAGAPEEAVDAGAPVAEVDAGETDAAPAQPTHDAGESVVATCVEHVPSGASRPLIVETFPDRGVSGYASELKLVITHGKGERVLPEGFKATREGDAAKALQKAGFVIPEPDGGSGPTMTQAPADGTRVVTTLIIPVVTLPAKAGRNALFLPRLPIAIARANNDYITVCTRPHGIIVDEPIANELDPKVKPNPPARPQREPWLFAKQLTIGIALGILTAVLTLLALRWWQRRPKEVVAPPKRLPWLVALEELAEIERSDLIKENRNDEYFDRVSDCVRRYLGARYGFEQTEQGFLGLETTSSEMRELLQRVRPVITELPAIAEFLEECDLVKFARVVPTPEECVQTHKRGEMIVRRTIPVMAAAAPASDRRPPTMEASS